MPAHSQADAPAEGLREAARDAVPAGVQERPASTARSGAGDVSVRAPAERPAAASETRAPEGSGEPRAFEDLLAPLESPRPAAAPPAAAAEAVHRMRSPLARNVAEQVAAAAAAVPPGEGDDRLVIRLKPQGMGIIEIEVKRARGGTAEIAMRVQNPMVLEALRAERQAMSDLVAGHARGEQLTMDLMSMPDRRSSGDGAPRGRGKAAGRGEGDGAADPDPEVRPVLQSATSILT